MILNACVKDNRMVDESICKNCTDKQCSHAGEPTTAERIAQRATQPTEINRWIDGCTKVCAFQWIDGKRIYFNVQRFSPGQSIEKPPMWDKTVYITDNEAGQRLVHELTHSLAEQIGRASCRERV